MPVSYQPPTDTKVFYIHPAPFVNIAKNFQKNGAGEILGVTYSITLEGTLLAGMGSPYVVGQDGHPPYGNPDQLEGRLSERAGTMDTGVKSDNKEMWGSISGHEYWALQIKQKMLMNLFSKINEGGELHISAPGTVANGFRGFFCHPRIVSLDFPSHDPGNPMMSKYTIQFETDSLFGPISADPTVTWRDYDSFIDGQRNANIASSSWMIRDAQENWDIQETDKRTITRADRPEQTPSMGISQSLSTDLTTNRGDADEVPIDFETESSFKLTTNDGEYYHGDEFKESLFQSHKVYELTRTISAVGKAQFAGRPVTPRDTTNHYLKDVATYKVLPRGGTHYTTPVYFWKVYNPTLAYEWEAWQQARGFCYDTLRYGNYFLKGENLVEGQHSGAFTSGFTGGVATLDNDDLDKFGMNLDAYGHPGDPDNLSNYKGWNYTRSQTVDKMGGSFSLTENWILAPREHFVMETVDISIDESSETGRTAVTISGSIEGLVDNAAWQDPNNYPNVRSDQFADYEADDDVDLNLGKTGTHTDQPKDAAGSAASPGNLTAETGPPEEDNPQMQSKYERAEAFFGSFNRMFYQTAQAAVNRLNRYAIKLNPRPLSASNGLSPLTGVITYSFTFDDSLTNFIPFVLAEDINVSDTYPGQVFGIHQVIGRTRGPVFQDIRTQTQQERNLDVSCTVGTHGSQEPSLIGFGKVIDDRQHDDITLVGNTTWNPNLINTRASEEKLAHETNPPRGYVKQLKDDAGNVLEEFKIGYAGDSSMPPGYNQNAMRAKPSSVPIQYEALKKIINMFRPIPGIDGVTKAFMNAPSEQWNPRTGQYSLNISWVYESDLPFTQAEFGNVRPAGFAAAMKQSNMPFPTSAVDVVENTGGTPSTGNKAGNNIDTASTQSTY